MEESQDSKEEEKDEKEEDKDEEEEYVTVVVTDKAISLQRAFKWAGLKQLPDGVELTLSELQEMACRQQQQIDSQHQLLVAKEQRLKFLKQQESRHQQMAAENERLRRLRERIEAQELKLRKLRALRGQVDHQKLSNSTLTSDLDSIRALFNEKEKELSLAVAKVEELTRQLEDLKRGRVNQRHSSPAAVELEKLRRELMYRNKLNEQQNQKISQQREALNQRQEEMAKIDKRISELQDRLHRKRVLNQQLANQINAATVAKQTQLRNAQQQMGPGGKIVKFRTLNSNIAAVEPFKYVPSGKANQPNNKNEQQHVQDDFHAKLCNPAKMEDFSEFSSSKNDPKYQTLPYNTKFTVSFVKPLVKCGSDEGDCDNGAEGSYKCDAKGNTELEVQCKQSFPQEDSNKNNDGNACAETVINKMANIDNANNNQLLTHTVHSVPTLSVSKGHATGLSTQNDGSEHLHSYHNYISSSVKGPAPHILNHLAPRPFGMAPGAQAYYNNPSVPKRSPPIGSTSASEAKIDSGGSLQQKPVSNVTPTFIENQKSIPVQQSSAKMFSLQSKAMDSTPPVSKNTPWEPKDISPPQYTSTPVSTPEINKGEETERVKPALPPKPSLPLKPTPPPRQIHSSMEKVDTSPDAIDSALSILRGSAVIVRHRGEKTIPPVFQKLNQHVFRIGSESDEPPPPPTSEPPFETLQNARFKKQDPHIKPKQLLIRKQPSMEHSKFSSTSGSSDNTSDNNNVSAQCNKPGSSDCNAPDSSGGTQDNISTHVTQKGDLFSQYHSTKLPSPPEHLSSNVSSTSGVQMVSTSFPASTSNVNSNEKCNPPESSNMTISSKAQLNEDDIENTKNSNLLKKWQSSNNNYSDDNANDKNEGKNLEKSDETKSGRLHIDISKTIDQDHFAVTGSNVTRRIKKGNLKTMGSVKQTRRVSFDPLALLLDASLEGELELVKKTAYQVTNPSAANDEGITALHNAICAGHFEIVKFLVEFGCDVNAQDSDGWTPLHCAASCNNLAMVKFLVEHGACIFATTLSDHETAAEKCEEDEEGFDGCSEYLYSVQEKLGILNSGAVYAVYDYEAQNPDELSFKDGDKLVVLRKGDEFEREWWWSQCNDQEGYIPRNLLGLYPRVQPNKE